MALRADSTIVHVTTYRVNLAEAFQRANSYQIGHGQTTTGTVADNKQTILANEASKETGNKKEKEKRKIIPRAEWLKLTTEQKDVIIAQSKQKTKPKCEFCDKIGHTESECRALKNTIAEPKKEKAKKFVAYTTSTPVEEEEEEEGSYEAVYVHSTETVVHYQYNPLYEDLVLCDHCASASIFRNKNLLSNLRPSGAITFAGIGGSINVTQQGDFGVFGTVAYEKKATFNALSVDSLPKTSVVTYDHADRCHTIAIDGKIYGLKVPYGKKGLPVRRFPYVNQSNVIIQMFLMLYQVIDIFL